MVNRELVSWRINSSRRKGEHDQHERQPEQGAVFAIAHDPIGAEAPGLASGTSVTVGRIGTAELFGQVGFLGPDRRRKSHSKIAEHQHRGDQLAEAIEIQPRSATTRDTEDDA